MANARWSAALALALFSSLTTMSWAQGGPERAIRGRWLGQDKHDLCGAITNDVQPNGVQDIHIGLSSLPPRREIAFASVTGHGADEWRFGGERNQFAAALLRKPGATTADLYFEPLRVETGREFCVKLKFDDGTVVDVYLKGGKADPNLRMPGAGLTAKWVGQGREDWCGLGPSVGPDRVQDAQIALAKLAAKVPLTSVLIEDRSGSRWAFGTNHEGFNNAEFLPDPKESTAGRLFFQPDRDLNGHTLKVTVAYEGGKSDTATVSAGRTDPKLAMPKVSLPRLSSLAVKARWLGQDGSTVTGPGDVHVALSGLPANRAVVGAVLSDPVRGVWVYKAGDGSGLDVEPDAMPLGFKRGTRGGTADLFFAPVRDETDTPLTLRLVFASGDSGYTTISGGACDVSRRAPSLERSEVVAKPGDDLNALANRHGVVRLSKGNYRLDHPLVLSRPVTVVGEAGAILTFAQGANEPPWTTAIKIHAGATSLKNFAVRFDGLVRWNPDVSWGPAVIGTTDNLDGVPYHPIVDLTFEGLDLDVPPASGKVAWEDALKLMRLLNATNGRLAKNILRGGAIEFFGGPWQVEENVFRGTPPGTFSPVVFAAHHAHDLTVRNNTAKPVEPHGKTWRFLLLTNRGSHDRVEGNLIEGIGPRIDDTIPAANSPEIVLTESYHVWFEGKPAAVSSDGRVVAVPSLRGEPPRTGDVVSVVSGPGAGQWRRIAQRIEPTVYLLDAPLPRGASVLSVTPGFVNEVFSRNTIDARGGRAAAGFVLAGNHYDTRVLGNTVKGAGDAFQVMAYPSESPGIWGWTHAPFFGGVVEGNIVEDSERGASFGVLHLPTSKSSKGRVYMTLTLKNNTVRWTEAFLSTLSRTDMKVPGAAIRLGSPGSLDPAEFVVESTGNRLDAPSRAPSASALKVDAAWLNGRAVTKQAMAFPATGTSSAAGTPRPKR